MYARSNLLTIASGKVRVKIITSRDALENFDTKKSSSNMDILSEEETSQFKKMILRLMVSMASERKSFSYSAQPQMKLKQK